MNERKTENIIREHFKDDEWYKNEDIILEEQKSENPQIIKLLKNASKNGNADGRPDFLIQFKNNSNFIIVIECKADVKYHKSEKQDKYKKFAIDGVKFYSSYLSKEFDVLAIAISGTNKNNLLINHFLQLKGTQRIGSIFANQLLTAKDYLNGYIKDNRKFSQNFLELLTYSKELNDKLHFLKIPESQRSLLIAGSLIALKDKAFYNSYKIENSIDSLINSFLDKIKTQLSNVDNKNIEDIITTFSFIKTNTILSKDIKIFKEIIMDIDEKINSFIKNYQYFDTLGQFYIEFLRYANNDKGLGIVLTPPHITQLFCELANVNKESVILDNCTGTGGFLISAMQGMVKDASGDSGKEIQIKKEQIIGIELQHDIFTLLCANMFIHGDGRSNLFKGSCFDDRIKEAVKKFKPNVGFLNPPYKNNKNDIDELEFVLNNLSMLEKGSYAIAIIPMQSALCNKGKVLALKQRLLEEHTLDAVLSMPNELFKNSDVGVNTCIMILKAKEKHPSGYKTWFAYCKDDGFTNKKTQGRADYDKRWEEIKEKWVNIFRNREEIIGFSVKQEIKASDEWCIEAYMKTDYTKLNKENFIANLLKYSGFLFLNNLKDVVSKDSIIQKDIKLKTNEWNFFKIIDLFDIEKGGVDTIGKTLEGGIPLVSSTEYNNGVTKFIQNNNKLFTKHKITVASNGSVGETFFQSTDFYATSDTNILIPKYNINQYIIFFIITIIRNEKFKFDYGRKWGKARMEKTIIKLPVNSKDEPDFEFMENYIKSLPYSKNLE
ncbi:MAG: N-6 DNA methylase [Elusimicrobiota bacterium]|jgi:hypothetical protein|nr:N-6 DNA methylase [Elusimicrobiota bacterium]